MKVARKPQNLSSLPAPGTSIDYQQFVTPVIQHIIVETWPSECLWR